MHHFVVAHSQTADSRIALCDDRGRFHVARVNSAAPALGTRLLGNGPKLGFGLLLGEALDAVYRVSFENVNCLPGEALQSVRAEGALYRSN